VGAAGSVMARGRDVDEKSPFRHVARCRLSATLLSVEGETGEEAVVVGGGFRGGRGVLVTWWSGC